MSLYYLIVKCERKVKVEGIAPILQHDKVWCVGRVGQRRPQNKPIRQALGPVLNLPFAFTKHWYNLPTDSILKKSRISFIEYIYMPSLIAFMTYAELDTTPQINTMRYTNNRISGPIKWQHLPFKPMWTLCYNISANVDVMLQYIRQCGQNHVSVNGVN